MYLVGGWTTHLNKLSQNLENVFPFFPLTIFVDVFFVVTLTLIQWSRVTLKMGSLLELNIKPWRQCVLLWLFFTWEKVYKHLRKCVAPIESAHPCELTSHIDFYIYFKTWFFWVHVYLPGSCWMSSILVVVCPPKQGLHSNQNKGHLGSRSIHQPPLHTKTLPSTPVKPRFHHPHLRLKVASAAWTANLKWTRSEPHVNRRGRKSQVPYIKPVGTVKLRFSIYNN